MAGWCTATSMPGFKPDRQSSPSGLKLPARVTASRRKDMTTTARLWLEFQDLPLYERGLIYALVLEIIRFKDVMSIIAA